MSISSRIEETVERWSGQWKDRLAGWMIRWTMGGIVDALEDMEPEQKSAISAVAQRLLDEPEVPEYIKAFLRQAQVKGNPLLIAAGVIFAVLMIVPMVFSVAQPLSNLLTQKEEKLLRTFRLDPSSVITAWRRDPTTYNKYFDDLREQGWSEERIEALKDYTLVLPGVNDLNRMGVREAFTPEIAEKFGQYEDYPGAIDFWAEKLGLNWPAGSVPAGQGVGNAADVASGAVKWSKAEWAAHWNLPGVTQAFEMFQRTTFEPTRLSGSPIGQVNGKSVYRVISEDNLKLLLRALDIMPPFRDALIKIGYVPFTRVDIRRMWDQGVLDDEETIVAYQDIGYERAKAEKMLIFTKVQQRLPDLLARWKNEWIGIEVIRETMIGWGIDPQLVEEVIQTKIQAEEPDDVKESKALTKTEIYKGVKQGIITSAEGVELIMDLGYSQDKAEYLLVINVEALSGSPGTFEEFKDITNKYKRTQSMEPTPVPEEIKTAGDELVKIRLEVEALERAEKEERGKLTAEEEVPDTASTRLKEIQVALNRARAELQRQQLAYNSLVARWKHGAG